MFKKLSVAIVCIAVLGIGLPLVLGKLKQDSAPESKGTPAAKPSQTIVLDVNGQSYELTVDDSLYYETDTGHPDSVEFRSRDLRVAAEISEALAKGQSEDWSKYYDFLLNEPLPVVPIFEGENTFVTVPDRGRCLVENGTLTVESVEDMTSSDHQWHHRWQGTIELGLKTNQGSIWATGRFDVGIMSVG